MTRGMTTSRRGGALFSAAGCRSRRRARARTGTDFEQGESSLHEKHHRGAVKEEEYILRGRRRDGGQGGSFFVAERNLELGRTRAGCGRVKCRARGATNDAREVRGSCTRAQMDWRVRRGERDAPRRSLGKNRGAPLSLNRCGGRGVMRFFPNGFASARRARAWTKYSSVQGVHAISRDSERDARCRRRRVPARRCEVAHARDRRKAANV